MAFGVYVHFPWCLRKCGYCDFASFPGTVPHAAYADAVLAELGRRRRELEPCPVTSVYFGGGTPSLWEPAELARVLDGIAHGFSLVDDVEITVEANPSSFDRALAAAWLAAGVNRVSIGVQSLDAERLRFLERLHDAPRGLGAVADALAAGVPRVSADLLFGVPGQSVADAQREAATLAELGLTHVSAYALTIEPNTPFGRRSRAGERLVAPEEVVAGSFTAVEATLAAQGFEHYEVSSYARDGHRSRHNGQYWSGADYLGLGCGAWGTVTLSGGRLRYRNVRAPQQYLTAWRAGVAPEPWTPGAAVLEVEAVDAEMALRERILLGLRGSDGVDLEQAARELGVAAWPNRRARALARLLARGHLVQKQGRIVIPPGSRLLTDGIIAELL